MNASRVGATPPSDDGGPAPYVHYVAHDADPLIRLDARAPWRWLVLGWRDFARAPLLGMFCGACFATIGSVLVLLLRLASAYVLALSAGFMLVGPFLCLGM